MTGPQMLWSLATLLVSIITVILAAQFNLFLAILFWSMLMLLLLMLRPE